MTSIEYLKLQAKNLHKDFKTQFSSFDPKLRRNVYEYDPKFFKIDLLIDDFNINEENFKLGNAQHVIAKLCGLEKWSDLSKASSAKIELSILLYTNMDRVEVRDWDEYVSHIETENKVKLDDEFKLQIFKDFFLEREQDVYYESYRLLNDEEIEIKSEQYDSVSNIPTAKISSLPLTEEDRQEFIEAANRSFDRIMKRIEPDNPELTRSLWDAERYIDEELLRPDMLPIDRDYALSLIEAFLVHHVIGLAVKADELVKNLNK
ncbi:hypothetical protein FAZ19_18950 [Sphingobacterium alkalisoli]|uniref:Uncharacterized protein n=1 Tax=Sphingobacterium alkalisoli TaxID=1874115 RepID=A0A4U0GU89_9SPHI|nr:hypothetical protein [Sphingobacterium alkalisoli]TJY62553.1 hypothetical protein FAZ19_18950 [Sphingobacterium alkalisoli]GGH27400.1 hypothetical protein GCM10011418_37320 [Sphingobacterium alkalisoli]